MLKAGSRESRDADGESVAMIRESQRGELSRARRWNFFGKVELVFAVYNRAVSCDIGNLIW